MHEKIKDLILQGIRITHPYKENMEDWVGDQYIGVTATGYFKPKVYSCHQEYELEDIDKAVDDYIKKVLSSKNLMYKMNQVLLDLTINGDEYDLDDEDDFEKVNTYRLSLIEKENN